MGLEPLIGQKLGVGERVAGVRVNGAQCRLAGGQVVRVARVDAVEEALRRLGDDPSGAEQPDLAAHVTAQLDARLQPPVGMTEEHDRLHAHSGCGRSLLALAYDGHLGP